MTALVEAQHEGIGRLPAGIAVSLALHLALLALLLLPAPSHAPPDERGIDVEILPSETVSPAPAPVTTPPTPPATVAPTTPRLAPPPATTSPSAPPAAAGAGPTADPLPPGWVGATTLLSGHRLAEPRNRTVAAHIAAMPADLRDEQLCDFEAVEQSSRPGKPADQVVAYAFAEPRQEPGLLVAEGAAIRIAGLWYRLAFRCRTAGAPATVAAFAYRLGAAVPRRLWAEHGLAAGGDD